MIKAIDNKIIVEELKRSQTSGGIVIPTTAVEPQAYGKIISLGEEVADKALKVGDIVVYHKMGGQAISMNNTMLCCVPYPEIYGVLEDEEVLKELEVIELKPVESNLKAPSLIQTV
jgi:co-chaperonin GroES (HSP10)